MSSLQRFADDVSRFPDIARHWNFEAKEVDIDGIERAMETMSHGERALASFFLSVWTHENQAFDLIDAAAVLDPDKRAVVAAWFVKPYWP